MESQKTKMSEYNTPTREGGYKTNSTGDDGPPMSRLFIICNKGHTEEQFREKFSTFGEIEDIWVVKDKQTGESKGIVYIKFLRTSDAARAQEEMNGKRMGNIDRPLKVLVAANRSQGSNKVDNEQEKYVRLFIVISKNTTEDELRNEFSQWGPVDAVTIVRDKNSGSPKGFGYVRFTRFYHAALAFENCGRKYRAVFAEPKRSTRVKRDHFGRHVADISSAIVNRDSTANTGNISTGSSNFGGGFNSSDIPVINNGSGFSSGVWNKNSFENDMNTFLRMQNVLVPQPTCLEVIASNGVNQDQLWRLFDIIPGLEYCQITREYGPRTNEAIVVYDNPEAAIYAKDKLHGLEYPIGERIIVKVSGMSSSRIDTSFITRRARKDSICNVNLPPAQPLAPDNASVAQRLFIVLASSVPQSVLKAVFSSFKGLIDVYLLPNKNCGYVKYADKDSASKAMHFLNGAEICGAKIKVLEAEDRSGNISDGDESNPKRLRRN